MKLRLGSRLLAIREERKLSQAEMADILGLPSSTYSRIERNETSVELEKLAGFAEALQVPIQELLPETLAITTNNNNSSQGGGVNFGTINYHFYGTDELSRLKAENEELKKKLGN